MKTTKTKTTNATLEAAVEAGKAASTKKTTTAKKTVTKDKATEKVVASKIAAEAVTTSKETKYIYPEGVQKDADKAKKFRAGVRRKVASFESELEKLKKSQLPEDIDLYTRKFIEFENYKSTIYTNYEPAEEAKKPTIKKKKILKKKTA